MLFGKEQLWQANLSFSNKRFKLNRPARVHRTVLGPILGEHGFLFRGTGLPGHAGAELVFRKNIRKDFGDKGIKRGI